MTLKVNWNREVAAKFSQLAICAGIIRNVKVESTNEEIEKLRRQVFEEARKRHTLETLKDNPTVRAYRDFFWSLDIDPTKTRPSGEALLRRVLQGKEIPKISNVVDAYNLASLTMIIPLSGFDLEKVFPPLTVRFSNENDVFHGICMKVPLKLERKMLVLADQKMVLCIYPHRDADETKITDKTRNVLVVGYGAPKIDERTLGSTVETALNFIRSVAGGEIDEINFYPCY